MENNLTIHDYKISRKKRNNQKKHPSFVLWFTGLSGSGKSTIANLVEIELFNLGLNTYSLDGDNIRLGINNNLGFTKEDRHENLRRIAEISKLFVDAGIIAIAAFISPLKEDREMVKNIIGEEDFIEIFIDTSLEECERRDVKGLYKKARNGEIKNFTGIDAPYETPVNPDLCIRTEKETPKEITNKIITFVKTKL